MYNVTELYRHSNYYKLIQQRLLNWFCHFIGLKSRNSLIHLLVELHREPHSINVVFNEKHQKLKRLPST